MKKSYLIGLGGSGGKVISRLYARLLEEKGLEYAYNVECIAIDTDQDELNKLAQLGVKKVCISGSETVGQLVNRLGEDVTEWCPDTANEGNFYSSSVFNGASQCRLKSRLCFSNFLKNDNNALYQKLEESTRVSPHGEKAEGDLPTIFIVSSIAGGTGSGIFIQVALYIKKFFRKYGLDVKIHGLFACPELYKGVVNRQQLPSLYANAYAVIRELNAFNLICGGKDDESVYNYDIDIEISSSSEGDLFEKDSEGRYGDKPYDVMYFVDKINYLSKTLGGLENYYEAMANIAYSHLYTEISGKVLSTESNEMHAHSLVPTAIYGSAGASTLRYPYEDILEYFASRSIKESVSNLWSVIDKKWYEQLRTKEDTAIASGMSKYVPKPDERAKNYIDNFDSMTKNRGISTNELSFLAPMVEKDGFCNSERLLLSIIENAKSELAKDNRINEAKSACGLTDLEETYSNICANIDDLSLLSSDDENDIFSAISDIDNSLETYCKKALEYVADDSISFANKILCDNPDIWDTYDKEDLSINIINSLLYNQETKEWIHPVAARYLLYKFSGAVKEKVREIIGDFDTAADDLDDFYGHLINAYVDPQKTILSPNDEELVPNAQILQNMVAKLFGKKSTKKYVGEYFENLQNQVEEIDTVLSDALVYFSLLKVAYRVSNLIEVYETFFDNIDDFIAQADAETSSNQYKHDRSSDDVYVCASADIKEYLYEEYGRNINAQNGETASMINKALLYSMRYKAAEKGKSKTSSNTKKIGVKKVDLDIFEKTLRIVVESAKNNVEIRENLDINIFDALLLEYKLMNPDYAEDESNYPKSGHPEARTRINSFVSEKFASLVKRAAPCLIFDLEDTYNAMFKIKDDSGNTKPKPKVSNSYRYLSHNTEVYERISKLVGGDGVESFYNEQSADLPKDTESQTVNLTAVKSDRVDKYSILCYSTVHCLQPYQIRAFDELNGGEFFEHYSNRIIEMERVQKYSMTPHLDKRWHKHNAMPYINIAKENEHRLDLAKAFLYALSHGIIGYYIEKSQPQFVYADRSIDKSPELMFFDGMPIPYRKINRAVEWLSAHEDLVERYSHLYEQAVKAETEDMSLYSDTVGKYKSGITNYARILRQMKRNIIRAIELRPSGNGRAKTLKTKESISVLELAWLLHNAEESESDRDYGELIVAILCNTIEEYAKAPYNARHIEQKREGSKSYACYIDVRDHITESFLETFSKADSTKKKATKTAKTKNENSYGRTTEDLSANESSVSVKTGDGSFEWAEAVIKKIFND